MNAARGKIVLMLLMLCAGAGRLPAETSRLWGNNGEAWSPASRLPDFSYAGYQSGEAPIPQMPVVADVKKFGATGDGTTDDSAAFNRAIDATDHGAILIPPGRYVLGDVVTINKSNIVLRGAGEGKSVLVIPRSLSELHPADPVDQVKNKYSFTGGFVTFAGSRKSSNLPALAQDALRGQRVLVFSDPPAIKPGQFVRLLFGNSEALGRAVHGGQLDVGADTKKRPNFVDWIARVTDVQGQRVTLDRPLRLDVKLEYQLTLSVWEPTVVNSGLEDLTFEFPGTPKKPHLSEVGFNAVYMSNVVNCWVKNIETIDADNGVIVANSRYCTIANCVFKAAKRKNPTGHHALWATGCSQDCLFSGFRIETQFVHDLTVEGFACGNVFMKGFAQKLNLDHHRNGPFENLFTELKTNDASRLWQSSGREDRGPHAGARNTAWNITYPNAEKVGKFSGSDFPKINVIGLSGYKASPDEAGQWVEPIDNLVPANLYDAQLARRLAATKP